MGTPGAVEKSDVVVVVKRAEAPKKKRFIRLLKRLLNRPGASGISQCRCRPEEQV